jgi:spermidine synthase
MADTQRSGRNLFYLLFAISGFSGLIYESIWSHYLKLFLGHAAYAQTFVLAIFMGGMAIGAWLPSRFGTRWKNLLAWYAIVEGIIGLCAVVFHGFFVSVTDLAYDNVLPALGSAWAVNLFKWCLAAILILPQSVLLGMTFPLMSAGLIRRYPANSGANLAMLYFTNSLGASIGVLVSGFVLIEHVGLPGTIFTAGLINIALALIVWALAKGSKETAAPPARAKTGRATPAPWRLLITVSLLTGAASFIYEIGWIRMLSLVLGSSTHAFELMLSAFILGLALGGLWIRHRIDRLKQPMQFLGWVQIAMGLLALGTLLAYNASFDLMWTLMRALTRTTSGYSLFNFGSHSIAVLIMVPVTFCAGMTLPLITHALLNGGHGEKSIGAVYAANTLGAIVGVFFAVHVGMPMLGLKGLITAGAAIDMALGLVLLAAVAKRGNSRPVIAASLATVLALVFALAGIDLDRYKMASGVYRTGKFYPPGSIEILFHKDGKTATVDLLRDADGSINISTNGKPDATLNMADGSTAAPDESTMIMAAAIPLLLHPQARTAANIGMGSGLTTHTLLSSPRLERVDTIEIEPAMIEAAQGFRPRVEAAFTDPRSKFFIDDAKTFFSAHQSRYDIIISEPSNPWVSGVAGLFSDEFYRHTRAHLNQGGLFVQWMQLYEIDLRLVASVMKAINRNFSDYALYTPNDSDLLIVAVKDGKVPRLEDRNFGQARLAQLLRRIDIHAPHDLKLRRLGDRHLFAPMFESMPTPVNSDYFPVLDLNAARARFMNTGASELISLGTTALPVQDMLGGNARNTVATRPTPASNFARSRSAYWATVVRDFYAHGALRKGDVLDPALMRQIMLSHQQGNACRDASAVAVWIDGVTNVMNSVVPFLKPSEAEALWGRFRSSDCYHRLSPVQRDVLELLGAVARRDATAMARLAEKLLDSPGIPFEQDRYLLAASMLGYLADSKPQEAQRLWKTYSPRISLRQQDALLHLLWAHSFSHSEAGQRQATASNAKK